MKILFTFFSMLFLCPAVWAQEPTIIKDINPEDEDGVPAPYMNAFRYTHYIVKQNGLLFFAADDGEHGIELWKTDGTETGTELLMDINQGVEGSDCRSMRAVGDYLLFEANNGTNGRELWRTDGTSGGTQMVADINPGVADGVFLKNALVWDNILYFAANDGQNGVELWRSDGTEAGTYLLVDIIAGSGRGGPGTMVVHDGRMFFSTSSSLWVTDGTEAGTELLKENIAPKHLVSSNGYLIFAGAGGLSNHEPWRSDGTEAGTVLIKEINPNGFSIGCSINPDAEELVEMGGLVYFEANDGMVGKEIWRTDGTETGTYMVRDASTVEHFNSCAKAFMVYEDVLYYSFDDGEHGYELWRTDGTESGTYMVKDILDGMPGALLPTQRESIAAIGDKLYFAAGDEFPNDTQLWESDGTEEGTVQITELEPGGVFGNDGISPQHFFELDNHVVFVANVGDFGFELWKFPLEMTNNTEFVPHKENIIVSPSVTSGQFALRTERTFNGQFDVTMFNLSGMIVGQWKGVVPNQELNAQGAPNGTYFLKIAEGSDTIVTKIIISNR